MEIKIKEVLISNFKGIRSLEVKFSDKTKIRGANGTGKTSIMDAVLWCMFGVDSGWNAKFEIRPLDSHGNKIHDVEISVTVILSVDGTEKAFQRVSKENWVLKRGAQNRTLQGNVGAYLVDGYPRTEQEYKDNISQIVSEELFKMITSPTYFSSRPWKDQRDILMKFVSDMPDAELARQIDGEKPEDEKQFTLLIPELEKAPSTDAIQKKYSKALSEWKKKQQEIPVRIDELSKSLAEIDVAEQELAKQNLERRIAEIDEKAANTGGAVSDLMSEEMKLQMDMSGIVQTMNQEFYDRKHKLDTAIMGNKNQVTYCKDNIASKEQGITENQRRIEQAEERRSALGEDYKAEFARTFDEAPYKFNEEEWQFDENSTICKSCGQVLPADRIEQIKADFEVRKAKAKEDAENSLLANRARFEQQRNDNLERIKADGFEQKHIIEEMTSRNESLQKDIDALKQALKEADAKAGELLQQYDSLPDEVDYSQNEDYVKLKARHDEVKAQIESLKTSADTADAFKEERKALVAELDAAKVEIAKASKNVEIEERIGQLQEEQREVGQKVADQEQMLYLLESFIKAKMERISDSINQHFKTVNFKLFETQLNGGLKECCECTVNGVPYSTLNSGHRIVAGLDIIQSLSELYGVTAPIFVDNAESLNEYNVPDMEAQMILLAVSDDKELVVEVA